MKEREKKRRTVNFLKSKILNIFFLVSFFVNNSFLLYKIDI